MAFDPAKHLVKLKGKDYLEVKWRLVWLRDVASDAQIDTDLISFNETFAVFKAVVTLPTGGRGTGYGSEEKAHFGDYMEKAETKAIGRALGALGFGTQFADDFADADSDRIADSPVQRPQQQRNAPSANRAQVPPDFDPQTFRDTKVAESKERAADRSPSWKAIYEPARVKGLLPAHVQALACKRYGLAKHSDMSADNMIDFADYIRATSAEDLVAAVPVEVQ